MALILRTAQQSFGTGRAEIRPLTAVGSSGREFVPLTSLRLGWPVSGFPTQVESTRTKWLSPSLTHAPWCVVSIGIPKRGRPAGRVSTLRSTVHILSERRGFAGTQGSGRRYFVAQPH